MINLVMLPFHDWKKSIREGFRTRDGHFIQEFIHSPYIEKLLIINRPISVTEMLILRRKWRPTNSVALYQRKGVCISKVGEKTFTLDIFIPEVLKPVLMRRAWTPYIFGHPKVLAAVNLAASYLNIAENFALFSSAPLFVPLIKNLKPSTFTFDAQDNLLQHAMYKNLPNLEQYYDYCLENADHIYANSKETVSWFREKRPDATHVANGVDTNTFNSSKSYSIPNDLKNIQTPIIGYAGKMQEMFDVSLMVDIVSKMKHVNFVFIGQQLNKQWMKPLWQYPNAYYLGDKQYQQLPNYLSSFDICIIPYISENQHGGDPIKFYEYLAMGKPIVTTAIGNVTNFREYPQVSVAESPEEFINCLENFITKVQSQTAIPKLPVPNDCLWQDKAKLMLQNISQEINPPYHVTQHS